MATAAITREDILSGMVEELASGVDRAVECWIAQVEQILSDSHLTTLGRMYAIRELVERYKRLTGKDRLAARNSEISSR
jgi:hypothetical protein